MSTKKIIIFASGGGTNAENIISYFKTSKTASVEAVFCNKKHAAVLERAERLGIRTVVFEKADLLESDQVLKQLMKMKPDVIVLAGFLLKIPEAMVEAFANKIINIHPALLPKYGGKGMYGMHVHRAVVDNNETESGITIHYVNQNYDEGNIIFQAKCKVDKTDTAEDVASKIHVLEMEHFPKVIESLLKGTS